MILTITDIIDDKHLSHFWYGGQCAKIEHKGYIASIEAIGDVYAEYAPNGEYKTHIKDKNNAGVFYHEMCSYIRDDAELYKAIENEDLVFDHNNWWECFIIDPQGNFHDLMWNLDADFLGEAIEEVKAGLDEMIKYIEEE